VSATRVLVVDDEPQIRRALRLVLRAHGYEVAEVANAECALDALASQPFDLMILDLVLPDLDGVEVCRRVREWSRLPVVVLSAHGEEEVKVRALDEGADDFVTKPFSAKQLLARMRAVLRRTQGDAYRQAVSQVTAGPLVLNLQSHEVTCAGRPVELTPLEFRLLYMLATNEGRVVPYSRLVEYAWGYFNEDTSGLLKSHICHLRKKLGLPSKGAGAIKAVLGVGYSLARPGADAAPPRELLAAPAHA
jgi:two-component system KDP operon response regulator KdpE